MPVGPFETFVNGEVMREIESGTEAGLRTELDEVYNYMSGNILNADIADGSIQSAHIFKPEVYGFPLNANISQAQRTYKSVKMDGSYRNVPTGQQLLKSGRFDIFPELLSSSSSSVLANRSRAKIPQLIKSVRLPFEMDVEVTAWFDARMYQADGAGGATVYPGSAGEFQLIARRRDGTSELNPDCGHRKMPLQNAERRNAVFIQHYFEDLAAGLWDIFVAYVKTSDTDVAISNNPQIVIGNRGITVEIYR